VPVGSDQLPMIEQTNELRKFNATVDREVLVARKCSPTGRLPASTARPR
jgi:tryptophanyl-tRNA synthetase